MGVSLLTASLVGQQRPGGGDGADGEATVARVGAYVQEYLSVARTTVAREMVTLQPLAANLSDEGRARQLTYETRVEWEPPVEGALPIATVHRQLLTVDGRVPGRPDEAGCLEPASAEPLAFLLPAGRAKFTFMTPVDARVGGQRVIEIEFVPVSPGLPSLQWRGVCGSFDLPGLMRGRITVEPSTFAVRRLDHQLVRPVDIPVTRDQRRDGWGDSIRVERADASIRYDKVVFHDPDETLRLPVEIRHVTEVHTPEMRRLRTVQRFSNYRRFVTGVRIRPVP